MTTRPPVFRLNEVRFPAFTLIELLVVIAYNYLGGHTRTPWGGAGGFSLWISPQTISDDSALPLVTDMNDWSPVYGNSFAPHGARGPILRDSYFFRHSSFNDLCKSGSWSRCMGSGLGQAAPR